MLRTICTFTTAITALCLTAPAAASVVLHGTRVVYPADARDVTIAAENNGDFPVLVQAWLDTGDPAALPEESKTPFILSPPLFRLDPKQTQSLRLVYTQDAVPGDRESLFWLNVLEIPPEEAAVPTGPGNKLRLIFRSRIKVFFRPKDLAGKATDAPSKVQWTLASGADGNAVLKATNPTAYHVTFSRIATSIDGARYEAAANMLDPGESAEFRLSKSAGASGAAAGVEYAYLNDYGVSVEGRATLRIGG